MAENSSDLLKQASDLIAAQQFGQALALADQVLASDPRNAQALIVKGISQAQMGQTHDASSSFEAAIAADPSSAKARYNYATHLFQQGDTVRAQTMAQEALDRDPSLNSARDLLTLIRTQSSAVPPQMAAPPGTPYGAPQQFAQYPREGYGSPNSGAIPAIDRMGTTWTMIGWTIIVLSLAYTLYSVAVMGPQILDFVRQMSAGKDPNALSKELQGKIPIWVSVVSWIITLSSLGWSILDVVNRRGNMLWLLPFICCTCGGMQWLVLPIYMVTARNKR